MLRRLDRRLDQAGLSETARAPVLDVLARAMTQRVARLGDDEHFEALHPARTLLILLDDCDVDDADVLAAAASVESEHAELGIEPASPLADAVPIPARASDALAEELVAAPDDVRLIALAERLDHARHLHLRPASDWAQFHASVEALYLPVAERTHPRLARRYAWWSAMFRRRFLEPRKPA